MKQVTVLFNGQKQATYLLDEAEVLVGRGSQVHIALDNNPMVSRRHALVRSEMDAHFLRDLGGPNGTYVNDARIKEVRLRSGDRITIGKHTIRYEDAGPAAVSLQGRIAGDTSADAVATAQAIPTTGSGLPPAPPERLAGAAHTMAASKDELEHLLAQMKIKSAPHLSVNVDGKLELVPLDEPVIRVGHTDDCHVRLRGRRFLGKIAATFELRKGHWWIVAQSPFWNPVKVGKSKLKKRRKLRRATTIRAGSLTIRFSLGESD